MKVGMNLRLIALVADDDYWNGVITEIIIDLQLAVWQDFPSKSIGMNTAVHEEPLVVPVTFIERLVVHWQVEAEGAPITFVIVVFRDCL